MSIEGQQPPQSGPGPQVAIFPDLRRKRIAVKTDAPEGATLHLHIDGTAHRLEGRDGEYLIDFPDFATWSPESPEHFILHVDRVQDDGATERLSTAFAMREFSIKDGRFHLNTHPFYLKGIWHSAPKSEAAEARREVEAARDAGFNTIFIEGEAAPAALLDAADSLGIVIAQPAENLQTVTRDLNRASVVIWTLADNNGLPNARAVRAIDPSRVILFRDADGSSQFLRPYRDDPEPYRDLRLPLPAPVGPNAERALRECGSEKRLSFISRFGFGTVDDAANVTLHAGFTARQLDRTFGDVDKFVAAAQLLPCDAARLQLDAIRSNPRVAGYCFAQLRDDGPVPGGGILDRTGQPKPGLAALSKIQLPLRPLIQMTHSNLVPRQETKVTILLANEARLEGRAEMSLQVVGPTNQVLWKKKRTVALVKHGRAVWEGDIAASGSTGIHRFIVRLMQPGGVIAESSYSFLVAQPATPAEVPVNILDPHHTWTSRCGEYIQPETVTAPLHIVPPLGNTIRAYPDNDLMQILAQVHGGAVALIFRPPSDWNDLAGQLGEELKATPVAMSDWDALLHYARIHPVFEGLPAKSLMRQPYKNLTPPIVFEEESEEDIAGALVWRGMDARVPATWASGILVRRYGSGLAVFTHMPLLEQLGNDMASDCLFANLLSHFSRRSVQSRVPLPVSRAAVEWMRKERTAHTRRWMLLGGLPNRDGAGHGKEYAPENEVNLKQQYPGWHMSTEWQPGYAQGNEGEDFILEIDTVVSSALGERLRDCDRTAYAYSEFSVEQRQAAEIAFSTSAFTKIWLNGKPVFDSTTSEKLSTAPIYVRQGKNTLLVKLSQEFGAMEWAYSLTDEKANPLPVIWWR